MTADHRGSCGVPADVCTSSLSSLSFRTLTLSGLVLPFACISLLYFSAVPLFSQSHSFTHTCTRNSLWYVLNASDIRPPTTIFNAEHHQPSQARSREQDDAYLSCCTTLWFCMLKQPCLDGETLWLLFSCISKLLGYRGVCVCVCVTKQQVDWRMRAPDSSLQQPSSMFPHKHTSFARFHTCCLGFLSGFTHMAVL